MLSLEERAHVAWRISTYSPDGGGNCVEAGPLPDCTGRVAVRHSHRPDGAAIVFSRSAWTTFLRSISDRGARRG